MSQIHEVETQSLRDSLRAFLRIKSQEAPEPKRCPVCSVLLSPVLAQLWLDGEDEVWNVPLQLCLQCHPELVGQISAVA